MGGRRDGGLECERCAKEGVAIGCSGAVSKGQNRVEDVVATIMDGMSERILRV